MRLFCVSRGATHIIVRPPRDSKWRRRRSCPVGWNLLCFCSECIDAIETAGLLTSLQRDARTKKWHHSRRSSLRALGCLIISADGMVMWELLNDVSPMSAVIVTSFSHLLQRSSFEKINHYHLGYKLVIQRGSFSPEIYLKRYSQIKILFVPFSF